MRVHRCFVEAAISAGVKRGQRRLDLAKRTTLAMEVAYGGGNLGEWPPEATLEGVCAAKRQPPLLPEDVLRLLKTEKKFTAGSADVDVVDGLYRRFFDGITLSATALTFSGHEWGVAEARQLAGVLPHFAVLKMLDVSRNKLDAAAAMDMAGWLCSSSSLTEVCALLPASRLPCVL